MSEELDAIAIDELDGSMLDGNAAALDKESIADDLEPVAEDIGLSTQFTLVIFAGS